MLDIAVNIFWSIEDGAYIALDESRPGCSAVGDTISEAYRELQDARKAWDGAKAAAAGQPPRNL